MNSQEIDQLQEFLQVPAIQFFESIGSTNDVATAWSGEGAVDGSLVLADTQTAGRGRHDRRWQTRPGSALAFSVILRPSDLEGQMIHLFAPLGVLPCALHCVKGGSCPQRSNGQTTS
jgi:BirA family biotin operon repressor/biotin-[acetyl-CoA-carboxylase] ligase